MRKLAREARGPEYLVSGYTHVNDTIVLANRVSQLEQVVARLLERVDRPEEYADLLADPSLAGQEDAGDQDVELDVLRRAEPQATDFGNGGFDEDLDISNNDGNAFPAGPRPQHRASSQTVRFGLQPLLEQEGLALEGRSSTEGGASYPPELDPRLARHKDSHETSFSKPPSVTEHEAALTLEVSC